MADKIIGLPGESTIPALLKDVSGGAGTSYALASVPVDASGTVIAGGGGGGGAATIADGADVAEGAKANSAATDSTSSWSVIALLKGILGAVLGTLSVQPKAGASGGASSFHLYSGTGTNATVLKASAGTLYTVVLSNPYTVAQGIHLYNLATTPSAGSATGVVATYLVPAGDCRVIIFPVGMGFSTGIGLTTIATSFSDAAGSGLAGVLSVDITYL